MIKFMERLVGCDNNNPGNNVVSNYIPGMCGVMCNDPEQCQTGVMNCAEEKDYMLHAVAQHMLLLRDSY